MGLQPIPGFCNGSYNSRAPGVSACRTVNMRVERNQDPAAKTPFTLFPRSGKRLFATSPTSPNFGACSNKQRVFVAAGEFLHELLPNKTFVQIGPIDQGTNPATMEFNGTQLLVCSAGKVYVATGTDLYQPIVSYARGTVTLTNHAVVWTSGDKFDRVVHGDLLQCGPKTYTVNVVTDNQHLTIQEDAGAAHASGYQAGTEKLTGATVCFIDGYFIVNIPNSKKFRICAPEDATIWDELDEGMKSGSTDNIAAVKNMNGQLALIGDLNSVEIWGDSGNGDFPFERISGKSMNVGTDAPWSVAQLPDGSMCWILAANQGHEQVVRSNGGDPVRISDHALENALRKYTRIDDAIASSYIENGHWFYRLDFPTANRTWEYDVTTGVWVELGIGGPIDEEYPADHARYHVRVSWPDGSRMRLGFDYASGAIWEISPDFVDDNGTDFPVMRIAPHVNSNLERVPCSEFALDCEMGTISQAAVDHHDGSVPHAFLGPDGKPFIPTVSMAYSDDGARTWKESGPASLGRSGEYEGTFLRPDEITDATAGSQTNPQVFNARPRWTNLGDFWISRTFKIKSTGRQLRAVYAGLIGVD